MTIKLIERLIDEIIEKSDIHRRFRVYEKDVLIEEFYIRAHNQSILEVIDITIKEYDDIETMIKRDYEPVMKYIGKNVWDESNNVINT